MKFLVLLTLAGFGLASPRFFPFEKTQNIYAHDDESSQQQIMKVLSSVPSSVKKINLKIFFGTESKCVKKGGFCNDSGECCGSLECDHEDLGKMPECKQF